MLLNTIIYQRKDTIRCLYETSKKNNWKLDIKSCVNNIWTSGEESTLSNPPPRACHPHQQQSTAQLLDSWVLPMSNQDCLFLSCNFLYVGGRRVGGFRGVNHCWLSTKVTPGTVKTCQQYDTKLLRASTLSTFLHLTERWTDTEEVKTISGGQTCWAAESFCLIEPWSTETQNIYTKKIFHLTLNIVSAWLPMKYESFFSP